MSDDEEEEDILKPGQIVDSSKHKYVIDKKLGEGGFGAVFRVHYENDPKKVYAMKVEKKIETRVHSKLKMEIAILKLVTNEKRGTHFTSIVDRGKKETYFFLVMDLVGKSLDNLKKERPNKVMSVCTALSVSKQCLEACEDLHRFGFIHRDLKPANYACGLAEKKRTIYILDFGIARKILNDKKELKTPRSSVRFKGTVKFASLSCHKNIEMGPKDDCESWFYLLLDLMVEKGLPWRSLQEKAEVLKVKEDCRKDRREQFFGGLKCKDQLGKILDYIDSLRYQDNVDYEYIYNLLSEGATESGGSLAQPYDWEKEPGDGAE